MPRERLMSRVGYTRASTRRMLTTGCTIYRPGAVLNEYNEEVTGEVRIRDTTCFLEELASRFLFQTPDFVRLTNLRWIIQMAWDEDVRTGDIVELKSSGTRFEVEGVDQDRTDPIFLKVDVHIL